jgi:hypothetical protein
MDNEQKYCRGPVAKMFNGTPGCRWIPNRNFHFSPGSVKVSVKGSQESGVPDGYVFYRHPTLGMGGIMCMECKAGLRSLFLGDPIGSSSSNGWHYHQRQWYRYNCLPFSIPYYLAIWMYPTDEVSKIDDGSLYLVPATTFLETEKKLNEVGSRYIWANTYTSTKVSPEVRLLNAEDEWKDFIVPRISGEYQLGTITRLV